MALVPPFPFSPEEIRASLAPLRNDFSVAIYSPGNAFAVGAIIRTAHSFLAREIIIIGEAPFYEKAAMGMDKYESVVRCPSDEDFFEHVKGRPLVAIEKDGGKRNIVDIDAFPNEVVFLLGSERFGIPEPILSRASDVLAIPMYGINHSFPVTVAAGIVMHEWARRRYGRGSSF